MKLKKVKIKKVKLQGEDADFSKETKPKTKQQRRKEKLKKEKEFLRLKAKKEKIELNNVFMINTYKKEILAQEKETKLKQEFLKEREVEKLKRPVTLSRHKYQPQDIEIQCSDEVTGNLRNLKPEGNLLEDRFKSLQRRRMLAASVRVERRRSKKLKRVDIQSKKMGFEDELKAFNNSQKQKMRNHARKQKKSQEMGAHVHERLNN